MPSPSELARQETEWTDVPVCPHCGSPGYLSTDPEDGDSELRNCAACEQQYRVTILVRTRYSVEITTWRAERIRLLRAVIEGYRARECFFRRSKILETATRINHETCELERELAALEASDG